jgi:hypothetical protein
MRYSGGGQRLLTSCRNRERSRFIGLWKDEYEFLAAIPRDKISRPAGGDLQYLSHAFQTLIALNVAVSIVVLLEVIDID